MVGAFRRRAAIPDRFLHHAEILTFQGRPVRHGLRSPENHAIVVLHGRP